MAKSILITGAARSGKSALAEARTLRLGGGGSAVYIATAHPGDAEMAERISRHRARRGSGWRTVEAPEALLAALHETDGGPPRLVDCLTLWLSNLMHSGCDWDARAAALAEALPDLDAPVVFVTNEVGGGIVPDNALARRFRDAAGLVNQRLAAAADEVWLAVAGQPMRLKPHDHPF